MDMNNDSLAPMRTLGFVEVNERAMAIERLQILNPYMTLAEAKAELAAHPEYVNAETAYGRTVNHGFSIKVF